MSTLKPSDLADEITRGFRPFEDYPTTVCAARYGGSYEGARYVGFPVCAETVAATDWNAEDGPCSEFWGEIDRLGLPIGRGATPNEALEDMLQRLEAWNPS